MTTLKQKDNVDYLARMMLTLDQSTTESATAPPTAATLPSSGDTSASAPTAGDPLEAVAERRRLIELAQTKLELRSFVQRKMRERLIAANGHLDAACLEVEAVAAELAALRKGDA